MEDDEYGFRAQFKNASVDFLIERFNKEVGCTGWVRARGHYLVALREAFLATGFNCSCFIDEAGMSLATKMKLDGNKIVPIDPNAPLTGPTVKMVRKKDELGWLKCHFWTKKPLEEADISGHFETVRLFVDTNHCEKSIVRCKDCGQPYYYAYQEEVVMGDGDYHYSSFVPITEAQAKTLDLAAAEKLPHAPRLLWDADPAGNVKIEWVL